LSAHQFFIYTTVNTAQAIMSDSRTWS